MQEGKEYQGFISLGRVHGSGKDDEVWIEVADAGNRIEFLCLKISLADLASLITQEANVSCRFALRGIQEIGKQIEHKTEIVSYQSFGPRKDAKTAKETALKPFEVDGWRGHLDDLGNMHCQIDSNHYRVAFHRYVAARETEPVS